MPDQNNLNELTEHFNEMQNTLEESAETEREIVDAVEELGDRMEPEEGAGGREAEEEEAPGTEALSKLPSIRGLEDDVGRAVGDIGDRRMVVMSNQTQLDILGTLRDIALIGLPMRGVVTKAIGSKL